MNKFIPAFILSLLIGIFISKLTQGRTIIISTPKYLLSSNNYIGVFDFMKFTLPESYWIESINYEINGAEKKSLHHAVLQNQSRKDYTCDNKIGERIHAAGQEMTPLELPDGYSYRINSRDKLSLLVHMINPTSDTKNDASLAVFLKVKPKNIFTSIMTKPVQPLWLDVVNCSIDPSFYIDPFIKQTYKPAQSVKAPYDANIVFLGGHFHKYGRNLTLSLGKNKYSFFPSPDSQDIQSINVLKYQNNFPVIYQNDLLDLEMIYENQSDKVIDGMGIGLVYISKK